jgi:hypothetical protein
MLIVGDRVVGFNEPISKMPLADLRDYYNAMRPYLRTGSELVKRRLADIEAEIEWRRAEHERDWVNATYTE